MPVDPILVAWAIAAPVVAAVAYAAVRRAGRRYFGPDDDWWENVRRDVLVPLNRFSTARGWGRAAYTLSRDEYAGRTTADPERVEDVLSDAGFTRMPLAAFKHDPNGRAEVGSWAYRKRILSVRQVHVILFEYHGGTLVYAHREFNAYNPGVALAHYLGIGYDPDAGKRAIRGKMFVEGVPLSPGVPQPTSTG